MYRTYQEVRRRCSKNVKEENVPIAHDETLPSPFLAKDIVNKKFILTDMCTVDLVIGSHDTCRAADSHRELEGKHIDFAQRTVRDDTIHGHPLVLLVITNEMLQGGCDALVLHGLAKMACQGTGKNSIFGERLESSSAQWRSLDVNGGTQDDVRAFGDGFLAHQFTDFCQQLGIPCRPECGCAREARGWDTIEEASATNAVGTIRHAQ